MNKKPPTDALPIVQKNDKPVNSKLNKKPANPVFIVEDSKTKSSPKTIIIDQNLNKITVVNLQKSDSVIIKKDSLGDLDSKNTESPKFSKTYLLIGVLVFILILFFFIVRKQKQSTIEKQQAQEVLTEQNKVERPEKLYNRTEGTTYNSCPIEIPAAEKIDLYAKLVTYYQNEKPYLNSNLKALDIAKSLQIAPRNITSILKENGFNGFNNFNNKYRVEEVIRQFEDPNYKAIKMEVISSKAGFGNRQTFYIAFEEFTGFSPGFYRSEILK